MGFIDKIKKVFDGKKDDRTIDSPEEIRSEIPAENNNEITERPSPAAQGRNFSYLDGLVHSGEKEIILESDITLEDDEADDYMKGIDLDVDGLVIDGAGHSIDGCGRARIFRCSQSVTLKNITLKNGSANHGGAIYNCDALTLYNTAFERNRATFNKGGAIYSRSSLNIIDSRFIGNEVTADEYSTERAGGAIYGNGDIEITGTVFEQNSATWGAIYCNSIKMNIEGSTFKNNGTVYGVIYNRESDITITESTFESNECNTVIDGKSRSTADFESETVMANLNMTGVKILDNYGHTRGGADIDWYRGGRVNIEKCTFTREKEIPPENMHDYILHFTERINVEINDTTFENCTVNYGAVSASRSEMRILECRFLNNACPYIVGTYKGNIDIVNASFKNNSCGIAVDVGKESTLNMTQGEFIANTVEESVIHNKAMNAYVEKAKFENNASPEGNLRAIHNEWELSVRNLKIADEGKTILNDGTLLIKGEPKDINSKIENHGKVYGDERPGSNPDFTSLDELIHESGEKEIALSEDITLEKYERDFFEGGIELDIDGMVIDGKGKTIDAGSNSRIFYVTGKDITLKDITFKSGRVYKDTVTTDKWKINDNGGAIRCIADTSINFINCRFMENSVDGEGGAIYSRGANITIEDCFLTGNNANSGGAISADEKDIVKIRNCWFIKNHAKASGGAILGFSVEIDSSHFQSNTSKYGGAMYIYGKDSLVKIDDSKFSQNHAARDGGALHLPGDIARKPEISNSEFFKNRCEQNYAVIYPERLENDFVNCILEENHANEIDFF